MKGGRRRITGTRAVERALTRGEPLRLIVVDADAGDDAARTLAEPARAAGVPVQAVGARHFERLLPQGEPGGALAVAGAGPARDADELLAREGPAWLLTGVAYPGNAGFAIRTAEVSGAAGVFLDTAFDHVKRREALRASMRADRFMPVQWRDTGEVLEAARAAGRQVVCIEDVGVRAPWEVDLRPPSLFVVGGEAEGIPAAALEQGDAVVRIPMDGLIRSYNLQAAVAIMAAERMRQVASTRPPEPR
ncbi:MAG: TrmH family RNA methyltransferase [Myxococcota bacterium]|nr:TrmH family RNA methyltransferase [Myxococcota bacterium]